MSYLELLAEKDLISKEDLVGFEKRLIVSPTEVEGELVKGGISPKAILAAKGEYFGIPVRDLGSDSVPFEVLKVIPEESDDGMRPSV
jgi:hypothetical protein